MIGGGRDCETRGKIKAEKGVGHRGEIVREGGEKAKQSAMEHEPKATSAQKK